MRAGPRRRRRDWPASAARSTRCSPRSRRQQQAAEEAIRVRDDFLSVASHELKTPLTVAQLQVQGLLDLPPRRQHRRRAERHGRRSTSIERQIARLDKLIDNLLDVSRIAAGRLVLERRAEIDLARWSREVIARFEPRLQRAQLHARRRASKGRSSAAGIALRLDQVVTNLLSTPSSTAAASRSSSRVEQPTATRAAHRARSRHRHRARRPGAHLRALRARRVAEHYGGLGLGLCIVRADRRRASAAPSRRERARRGLDLHRRAARAGAPS